MLDDSERRGLCEQTRCEGLDFVTGAADLDEHPGRVVADVADETVFAGEPVDEGPEPDALHHARDGDVLGHALIDREARHWLRSHTVTRLLFVGTVSRTRIRLLAVSATTIVSPSMSTA